MFSSIAFGAQEPFLEERFLELQRTLSTFIIFIKGLKIVPYLVGQGPHMGSYSAHSEQNRNKFSHKFFQKFLEVQKPFFKRVSGGVWGKAPCS
jgi:hypothetical protein